MPTQDEVNEVVYQYLIQNHFYFLEATKEYKKKKETLLKIEDPVFSDEIKEQYRDLVRQMLVDAITRQFAFPAENVIISLEGVNVDAYL